ncbi:MAG: hypothetical protein MZW92_10175 [Comamonadaceae bacterium]|nr:hypothetical protein [Comamonadaceae bacterium]
MEALRPSAVRRRSRSAASGRSSRPRAAALHERGALPPEHGLHALPGRRDAARVDGRDRGRDGSAADVYRVFVDIANPKVAPDDPGQGGPEQRRPAGPPDSSTGKGVEVIAASFIDNKAVYKANPSVTPLVDQKDLKRILVRNGTAGQDDPDGGASSSRARATVKVTYDSVKGGS